MIHVRLDQFEGPLGLLLHLIRKDEMDIANIQIHTITTQYLEHIKRMRELDLEVAGDFIAMAATLIHIKSRMLLPQYDENGEIIEDSDDPRKELVQKLMEYQKFQEASKELNNRKLLGRDIWARGMKEEIPMEEGEIIVDEGGLFSLISMYRKVVKQIQKNVHNVRAKGQSIAARILELRDRLIPGRRVSLRELVNPLEMSANKILITFLSLLELTKMGFTTLFQTEAYSDIYVDTKQDIDRDVIERVEEYDAKPDQAQALLQQVFEAPVVQIEETQSAADQLVMTEMLEPHTEVESNDLGFIPLEMHDTDVATNEDILAAEKELGFISSDDFEMAWADFVEPAVAADPPAEPTVEASANIENSEPPNVLELVETAKNAMDAFENASVDSSAALSAESSVQEILADEDEEFAILETVKTDIERGSNDG